MNSKIRTYRRVHVYGALITGFVGLICSLIALGCFRSSVAGGASSQFGLLAFGIIVTLLALFQAGTFLFSVLGRYELRITDSELELFRGIGPLGLTRRWSRESVRQIGYSGPRAVALDIGSVYRFGTYLRHDQRDDIVQWLRESIQST